MMTCGVGTNKTAEVTTRSLQATSNMKGSQFAQSTVHVKRNDPETYSYLRFLPRKRRQSRAAQVCAQAGHATAFVDARKGRVLVRIRITICNRNASATSINST